MEPNEMDFNELRYFIKDSLLKLSESGADSFPRTEADLLSLVEKLEEKIEAPSAPGTPSQADPFTALRSKLAKRERLIARWQKARRGDPPTSRRDIHRMERRLETLDREIDHLEAEHPSDFLWHEGIWYRRADRNRPSTEIRSRMVKSLRRAIKRTFDPSAEPTGRVHWRLVPPSESSQQNVRRYYRRLNSQGKLPEYDEDRLNKVLSLPYDEWLVENEDQPEGYSIFTFAHTSKVLMECFMKGNAIYIIDSDWQYWSRRSKKELREQQVSGVVTRIPHQGNWFEKLKENLEIGTDGLDHSA